MKMRSQVGAIGLILICLPASFAQSVQPIPAPSDVVLQFTTDSDRTLFRLGDEIPVKFSYTAATPNKYLWVSDTSEVVGGRSVEVSCSSPAERLWSYPQSCDVTFDKILMAPCGGAGCGFGGGGEQGHGWDKALGTEPYIFQAGLLNRFVRFRKPGKYSCQASSADVTIAPRDEKFRPALLVKSNSLILTIVDDPAWSHAAAISYGSAYEKACHSFSVRQDVVRNQALEDRLQHCSELARRLTYLDNVDSLAVEVKEFDGWRTHGWDNSFWEAIATSSQPEQALHLMTARMQDPDFQVSDVMEWLASSDLKLQVPEAFDGGDPARYHAAAVEAMRKYVRLLGESLSHKDAAVLPDAVKTYRLYAEMNYCEGPLIPPDEEKQVLADLQ